MNPFSILFLIGVIYFIASMMKGKSHIDSDYENWTPRKFDE